MTPSSDIDALLAIMAELRTPGSGCPWDLAQTFATIAPYTIEEAHEVADAISRGDLDDLKDELGDLLLQVVFHARMAEEQRSFAFGDVVMAITEKLVRRHPHVFGDAGTLSEPEVNALWDRIKSDERAAKALRDPEHARGPARLLSAVAAGLPALARARKLQAKAASVGFDWGEPAPILDKIREETEEVATAARGDDRAAVAQEIGDLLFAVVNLARHYDIDPETALRATNLKFERRFAAIEDMLAARGKTPAQSSLQEMDALWDEAKRQERETTRLATAPPDGLSAGEFVRWMRDTDRY